MLNGECRRDGDREGASFKMYLQKQKVTENGSYIDFTDSKSKTRKKDTL